MSKEHYRVGDSIKEWYIAILKLVRLKLVHRS
jgi:hypothetical protein